MSKPDYLRKVIVQDRSSKYTKVGEIMTDQKKNNGFVIFADNHIRHVPVIDGKIIGMISIGDVVRAVLEQQHGEVKRLNEFIHGDYY
ncbi:hypothetical protein RD792_012352 [Penstemon davidsonii]|uniref:CBS domain-containing protein n=1 Tax=Penstemon davidsonii TaxID=160366 RepID=A0ABR0CWL6_9LAMI|nr:hypothetical protein RD792_012352 [Penstemon davidsonii]